LDEATAALDNETQKKVAENISKLQKQQGFTIVQIAHRLTTLTDSDIIYFLDHGTVAETGGLHTQNGSAVDELNKIDIAHRTVLNPETGEEEQRIDRGFFHHHWNAANDIKAFHEMNAGKLSEKVRELRCDLDVARAELGRRNAAKLLPPLVLERALTHPASSCRYDDISDHGSTTPPSSETCDFCDPSSDEDMTSFPQSTPSASGTTASMLSAPKLSRAITSPAA